MWSHQDPYPQHGYPQTGGNLTNMEVLPKERGVRAPRQAPQP